MPPVPAALRQQINAKFPKPRVNPEWLQACYDWISEEHQLGPHQLEEILGHVERQYLASDLDDSAVPSSGFPDDVNAIQNGKLDAEGKGILCQITAITDVGNSAFSLRNVRQTRIDKADMSGLGTDDADGLGENAESLPDDGEDYTIPNYPRSMLKMMLSDGTYTISGIEYRRISALQLGATPLGCKLMLKNVMIRKGIAFLEPANVVIYDGSRVEELDTFRDRDFNRFLRVRMGLPEIDSDEENGPQDIPQPPSPPAPLRQDAARAPVRGAAIVTHQQGRGETTENGVIQPSYHAPPAISAPLDESFTFDDDDDIFNTQLLERLDQLERERAPSRPLASKPKRTSLSSDARFENLNEEALRVLDEAERSAVAIRASSSNSTHSPPSGSHLASPPPPKKRRLSPPSNSRKHSSTATAKKGVIEIDDDSDTGMEIDSQTRGYIQLPSLIQRQPSYANADPDVIELSD